MVIRRVVVLVTVLVLIIVAAASVAGCMDSPEEDVEQVEVYQEQAEEAAREANLRTIDSAVQMYYAEEGVYPSSIGQLFPRYFDEVPTDPAGGAYYLVKEGDSVKAAVK